MSLFTLNIYENSWTLTQITAKKNVPVSFAQPVNSVEVILHCLHIPRSTDKDAHPLPTMLVASVQSLCRLLWLTCASGAVIGFYVVSRKWTPPPTCEPHREHHAQRVEERNRSGKQRHSSDHRLDVAQRTDSGAERRCPRQVPYRLHLCRYILNIWIAGSQFTGERRESRSY